MRAIYQGKAEEVLSQFPDACFDALSRDAVGTLMAHYLGVLSIPVTVCIDAQDEQYQQVGAA